MVVGKTSGKIFEQQIAILKIGHSEKHRDPKATIVRSGITDLNKDLANFHRIRTLDASAVWNPSAFALNAQI